MSAQIELLVRNRTGDILGVLDFFRLEMTKRWRDVGAWSLTLPNSELARALATPGHGIVVRKRLSNGEHKTLMSGPMHQSTFSRDAQNGRTISCMGFDDLIRLWDVLAFPSPEPFTAAANDIFPGPTTKAPAETVIKHYVAGNATNPLRSGVDTDTAVLTVAPDTARGADVRGNARFDILGDLVQSLAITGGLGLTADNLVFDVLESQDRRREQVFSFDSGNLETYSIVQSAPTCTLAVVAGQGEGTARQFAVSGQNDFPDWGRNVERFFDQRQTDDPAELGQKGLEELTKGQAIQQVAISPIDVPHRRYGVDWNLGDTVTCEGVVAVVTEVIFTYDENGLQIKPTVAVDGNQTQVALRIFDEVRAMRRRVSALERAL